MGGAMVVLLLVLGGKSSLADRVDMRAVCERVQ
jgi:hypothetical protein